MSFVQYIANEEHYKQVLSRIEGVKHSLWIGTADIKDVYVAMGTASIPLLKVIAELIERNVEVRLIHAKEPGPNFRADFDKYPALFDGLDRMLCQRVHFKMVILDHEMVYFGSANLTGAGIGMKSTTKRNFEAGILTDDPELLEAATEQFDEVWMGRHCAKCAYKDSCPEMAIR